MLNPKTMTPAQEEDARAKAFHLLKKYTSLTFLEHAVGFYRRFLEAYERQLDAPSPNQQWLEKTYTDCFLRRMIELEQGIDILHKGEDKGAAYRLLVEGSKFSDYLWGVAADHWGIDGDPFFLKLGLRHVGREQGAEDVYVDPVKSLLSTNNYLKTLKCSLAFDFSRLLTFGHRQDGGRRFFSQWTYESLFQGPPAPGWTDWPPARAYPPTFRLVRPITDKPKVKSSAARKSPSTAFTNPGLC